MISMFCMDNVGFERNGRWNTIWNSAFFATLWVIWKAMNVTFFWDMSEVFEVL